MLLSDSCQAGEFCGPSVEEFAPSALLFHGTFLEVNRIILIRFLAVGLIIAFFGSPSVGLSRFRENFSLLLNCVWNLSVRT